MMPVEVIGILKRVNVNNHQGRIGIRVESFFIFKKFLTIWKTSIGINVDIFTKFMFEFSAMF